MNALRLSLPPVVLLLLGGFFLGFSGSVDDAHITFWSAWSLAHSGEIVNYNLERVEQSSALLQTVVLALLHALSGMSVVTLAHLTTMFAALTVLILTARMAQQLNVASQLPASFLLATTPFFVYWACGGMEGPLLALLLLLLLKFADAFLKSGNGWWWLAAVSLAAQMSRPEMPLVLCAFTVLLCLLLRSRRTVQLLLLQLLCAALLTAWRWWYFGDILPQPVNAKTGSGLAAALQQGWRYLQITWLDARLLPTSALILLGVLLVLLRAAPVLLRMTALLALVYIAFVLASGGDWMAAGRFWVPIAPLLMWLVAHAIVTVCKPLWLRHAILVLLVMGNVLYLWRGTTLDFNGVPLWKTSKLADSDRAETFSFFERHAREHLHDIPTLAFVEPVIAQLLAARSADAPALNVMAGQMGMVPFYLSQRFPQQLHFSDRNGITERTFTHCAATQQLLRTRNGIGTGYGWIIEHHEQLQTQCGFTMPDVIFDIEAGWNRRNIEALAQAGYVFIYRQRGHIVDEPENALLPLRRIYAGQFIAVSQSIWQQLDRPQPVERVF